MKHEIELFASDVQVQPLDAKQVVVYIEGVDASQVVAELPAQDILESLDMSDILDFVSRWQREEGLN